MSPLRYLALAILTLSPALAVAQLDSIHVAVAGVEHPAYVLSDATVADTLGPHSIVTVEPASACEPLANPGEVAGTVALVSRGGCTIVEKAQRVAEAGAVAVVVYNTDVDNPDDIHIDFCTVCPPYETTVPTAFVSYNSGQAVLDELAGGPAEVTLIPIRVAPPVAVEEARPEGAAALAVYPNPSRREATVEVTLGHPAEVRVTVVDVVGREVAVLHDGPLAAGAHALRFEGAGLPSGLYLVRVEAEGTHLTQRLTLAR